jgi:SAM-dependent methyltransferase
MSATATPLPPRSPWRGLREIVAFNRHFYAIAATAVIPAGLTLAFVPLPLAVAWLLIAGVAFTLYTVAASLAVSHWVYDRSELMRWTWLPRVLGDRPARWVNLHAGLDESTPALRAMWPGSHGRVLDFFDAAEMSEPSILRARALAHNVEMPESADFRRLPLRAGSCDAALLLLSAHELRRHDSRVALLAQLRQALAENGVVVLAEHLRDVANALAFGPGALHFHSERTWRRAIRDAGLCVIRTVRITPFVKVFVMKRSEP